jgi:hypothetical protein
MFAVRGDYWQEPPVRLKPDTTSGTNALRGAVSRPNVVRRRVWFGGVVVVSGEFNPSTQRDGGSVTCVGIH